MSAPSRFAPSGLTQAAKFQPLGNMGQPDPFFYATSWSDFLPYNAAQYTVTAASGSVAQTVANGSGGRILLTTGATGGNFASIQSLGNGIGYVAGKKIFFLTRIQVASISTAQIIAGLISTNVTPFTAVVDGIYFLMSAGSSDIVLLARTGSVTVGTLTISGAITANTDIDLGFFVNAQGDIKAFVGPNLEGAKRQDSTVLGPNYGISAPSLTGALTTALLTPTVGVSNGATAAAMTAVSDFLFGAMER